MLPCGFHQLGHKKQIYEPICRYAEVNTTVIISSCSLRQQRESLLTKCVPQQCSWPGREGEINIYHVCVGVLFCFTLFSHRGVSGAVSLNTRRVSCIVSALTAVLSQLSTAPALISHQVAIISPSCTHYKCSSSNQTFSLCGTLCGLIERQTHQLFMFALHGPYCWTAVHTQLITV